MGKYTALRCTQLRKLIEENKYVKAFEMIQTMNLTEIQSISDLNLIAKVYLNADYFTEAKQIYHGIYERTHSRLALYRLILLCIRMGDLKEARAFYFEYELSFQVTLDTYELRYRLAKAEGASRESLIQLLEELKKEEFTEEWGYELARMHELEGNREACISVCEDLILWFGEGTYVNKAEQLKAQCESSDWVKPQEAVSRLEKTEMQEKPKAESEAVQSETVLEPEVADNIQQDLPEIPEERIYLSDNGLSYYTLKDTIVQLQAESNMPILAIAGGEDQMVMAITKRIVKEMNRRREKEIKTIAKIRAEKFNNIDLRERIEGLLDGCMLILAAQDITPEAADQLERAIDKYGNRLLLILAGEFDELDCWFNYHREIESRVLYKIKVN